MTIYGTDFMPDAQMKTLIRGRLFWASRRFDKPGLVLWIGKKNVRIFPVPKRLPHLNVWIDLGFIVGGTQIWYECPGEDVRKIVRFHGKLFGRGIDIDLYTPEHYHRR